MSALVAQKDVVYRKANTANVATLMVAYGLLAEYLIAWCRAEYHYKGREICDLMLQTIEHHNWRGDNKTAAAEIKPKVTALRARYSKAEECWKGGEDYCFDGQCAPADWVRV
jgi:hypothetical protein